MIPVRLGRSVSVQNFTIFKKTKPQVRGSHHELLSVVAELLWRRSEVVSVIADVGADAAALAPPLVTVGGETRKSKIKTL